MRTAAVKARSNIALVKYWGKRVRESNLPATGSISVTLSGLHTVSRVSFNDELEHDELWLDGRPVDGPERQRVGHFLSRIRRAAGIRDRARVVSKNNFPTGAGLASSASGFAALAAAACRAAGLSPSLDELSDLARRGSGSAPRSLLGGFVELSREGRLEQIAAEEHWDIRVVIAVCARERKRVGSTQGMERSRLTSPFYPAWLEANQSNLRLARRAIDSRDFGLLGRVVESSSFRMHAVAMSSDPPLLYFNPTTLTVIQRVRDLRGQGLQGYLTIDAGPQVKVLCRSQAACDFVSELRSLPGVAEVLCERPGPGVEYLA